MNIAINILTVVGTIDSLFLLGGIIWAIYLWLNGVSPALYRLGNGLSKRKIAIFAKDSHFNSLRDLLIDSHLFKERNIVEVSSISDIGKAESCSLYLVYWPDWKTDVSAIIQKKPDSCALVVYAPRSEGPMPEDQMNLVDNQRNGAVTNFRGRLLNDVVTSMITTSI